MTPQNKKRTIFTVGSLIILAGFSYPLFVTWLNSPYMLPDDPNNPGSYGGLTITNSVKLKATQLTNIRATPHQQVMIDMNWTRDHIEFKSPPPRMSDPDVIIKSKVGLCGDYAIVVTSLLACQGYPSRIIGMYNQTKGAHVVIEVYYNNAWHMYGPTHQSYWELDGNVLSFDGLRNGLARNATLHYTPSHIPDDYYLTPDIYEYSDPAGVIGPQYPMWWPLTIDTEYIVPPVGYYAAGSRHIGATYTNNCQNWTVTNLTPGYTYKFIIYQTEIRGTDEFELYVNETGRSYVTRGEPIEVEFTADDTIEVLHVGHDYRGPTHVLMMIEKYEVGEVLSQTQ